ncbi:PA4642 family protein [Marinobacter halotolerans]|uniref:PA4642 family protein n=1 Tax=Marinobacter halotolerans TaxID=1569211 RepID=UPI001247BED8|nr:PA4642 family protein [Marinobacter halotolerans]
MSGPDKPKVIGEEWSDERVKGFLAIEPYDSAVNPDFNALLKAYQAMRAEDFERFVGFFVEAGRDLNGVNERGETILDLISQHRRSTAYADILKQAGAKTTAAG